MILAGWESRATSIVLPNARAWTMFDRARRFHVGSGGRFEIRRERTIVLWSQEGSPRPVAAVVVAWRAPDRAHATVRQIAWDAAASSEEDIRQALALLTQGPE